MEAPGDTVGYTVYRIINYTNVCSVRCSFCSFCRGEGDKPRSRCLRRNPGEGARRNRKARIRYFSRAAWNQTIPLSYYEDAPGSLQRAEDDRPRFFPVELVRMSRNIQMPLPELLRRLKDAGLSPSPAPERKFSRTECGMR